MFSSLRSLPTLPDLPDLPAPITRVLPRLIAPLGAVGLARRLLSREAINRFGYATTLRPRPLSLVSDYTSWRSLTDRSYSGRHLPPATPEFMEALPAESEVLALFRREREIRSTDTSVMFVFFAQWFVDSFLSTDREDWRKNHSNHDIDLCQIYGKRIEQTNLLRSKQGGRLKSQVIEGEEYPAFLFESREPGAPLVFKAEFEGLHDEEFITQTILGDAPDDRKDSFFAVGLEHGNSTIGNTMMNIVWFREHNRLAGMLAAEHPGWDDDRLFETARNIATVLILKIVVEEYIKHIGPFDFPVEVVPFIADGERWNRTNWSAVEFNLLYRWHSLVPDTIGEGAEQLKATEFRNNNPLVLSTGIEALMKRCSNEPAGKIGLLNTPYFLTERHQADRPSIEERTIALSRKARLQSFNQYREAYGLDRVESFEELTSDAGLAERLETLYGHIDNLEWYVGIFAEDYPDYMMMGELITTMVANDAFTQALTNPLLARHVFTTDTFSEAGMRVIAETGSLEDIAARNSTAPDEVRLSFKC